MSKKSLSIPVKMLAVSASAALLTACVAIPPTMEYLPCPTPPEKPEFTISKGVTDEPSDRVEDNFASYASEFIGYGEANAEACVIDAGFGWRVTARDGEFFPMTLDYRVDRINVEIVKGKVASVNIG